MNRKLTDLSLLMLIVIAGAAILFMLARQRAPFGKNNSSFSIDEKTEISRVVFFEGGSKLVLERNGKNWSVGGEAEARPLAVNMLLLILRDMQVKSPVGPEVFKEMISGKPEPVKVFVYSGWMVKRSFFVYHTSANAYGNIMKMRVASRPFIMHVPGVEEDIGAYFTADPFFWKPFMVFNIMPSELSFVEVRNLRDTNSSFKIYPKTGELNFESAVKAPGKEPDTSRIKRYLSYFSYVPFEKPVRDLTQEEINEIVNSEPLYIITAGKKDGTMRTLKIWEKSGKNPDGVMITDTDRAWGMIEGTDRLVIMRYFDIDPILRNAGYFLKD